MQNDQAEKSLLTRLREASSVLGTLFMLVALPVTVFLAMRPQDIRQSASADKTAKISIAPSSANFLPGEDVVLNLVIDGGGQQFISAEANVTLSNNLSVKSLTLIPLENGGCGFTFVNPEETPSVTSPSFSGSIPSGGASKNCTLYTMVARGTATGPASVSITQASVIGFETRGEILLSMLNGLYTVGTTTVAAGEVSPTLPISSSEEFSYEAKVEEFPPSWVFLLGIFAIFIGTGVGGFFTIKYLIKNKRGPYDDIPLEHIGTINAPKENPQPKPSGLQAFNLGEQQSKKKA